MFALARRYWVDPRQAGTRNGRIATYVLAAFILRERNGRDHD
jgi:hypothetical protein